MTEKETFTFPTFHERSVPLTDADNARIELTQLTRALIRESFVSTASDDDMQAAIDAVRTAVEAVKRATGRDVGAFNSNFMDRSPFMGLMNPLAPPMSARLDPDDGEWGSVLCAVTFTEPFEGPPGHVHGGFLAGVFDEILGQAQSLSGRPGMTGSCRSPTAPPRPSSRSCTCAGGSSASRAARSSRTRRCTTARRSAARPTACSSRCRRTCGTCSRRAGTLRPAGRADHGEDRLAVPRGECHVDDVGKLAHSCRSRAHDLLDVPVREDSVRAQS